MRISAKKYLDFLPERSCPLCGSSDHCVLSQRMQFKLDCTTVICRHCGFCYVSPPPTKEAYNAFYREAYAWFYRKIHRATDTVEVVETSYDAERLKQIDSYKALKGANVLEVGPGQGRFLRLVARRGAKVSAIEPSEAFRQVLQEQGVDVLGYFLEDTETAKRFDVIMLFQVLEHIHDPVDAVRRIRGLLAPNGIVVLDVPNIWKPYRSLDRYFLRYVHLSYFSPTTLRKLFIISGFDLILSNDGFENIYEPQHIFAIAKQSDSEMHSLPLSDNWRALRRHLNTYRIIYPLLGAPRIYLREIYRRLRRKISCTVVGEIVREFKKSVK